MSHSCTLRLELFRKFYHANTCFAAQDTEYSESKVLLCAPDLQFPHGWMACNCSLPGAIKFFSLIIYRTRLYTVTPQYNSLCRWPASFDCLSRFLGSVTRVWLCRCRRETAGLLGQIWCNTTGSWLSPCFSSGPTHLEWDTLSPTLLEQLYNDWTKVMQLHKVALQTLKQLLIYTQMQLKFAINKIHTDTCKTTILSVYIPLTTDLGSSLEC